MPAPAAFHLHFVALLELLVAAQITAFLIHERRKVAGLPLEARLILHAFVKDRKSMIGHVLLIVRLDTLVCTTAAVILVTSVHRQHLLLSPFHIRRRQRFDCTSEGGIYFLPTRTISSHIPIGPVSIASVVPAYSVQQPSTRY